MTNKKTLALVALIAVFVSVIGGFVVYAALTQRLDIEGSANFVPESWKVNFKSGTLSNPPALTGGADVHTAPSLTDTLISDFKVILTREGDSVTYTFDIENTGYLDAKLTSYVLGTPSCEGTGTTKIADEAIVCSSDLSYTLKYVSGDLSTNGLSAGGDVAINDMLKKQTTVKVALKLEYSSFAISIPTDMVEITGLDTYLIYTAQ